MISRESIRKRIRVIHKHTGPEHRHHMFYPGNWRDNEAVVYLDAIGRKTKGMGHPWLPLVCGIMSDCKASALVRRDLLEDLAQDAMEGMS